MKFMNRMKYAMNGEDGAISIEMIGWIAIITFIVAAAFLLRDQIIAAMGRGGSTVDDINFGKPKK